MDKRLHPSSDHVDVRVELVYLDDSIKTDSDWLWYNFRGKDPDFTIHIGPSIGTGINSSTLMINVGQKLVHTFTQSEYLIFTKNLKKVLVQINGEASRFHE